ncbi:hypothetical protein CRUP_028255 [Coryphaenoides rupestris]|nr:hypothetical protein CRUP_028255 [Coryphaenoides rupestris]
MLLLTIFLLLIGFLSLLLLYCGRSRRANEPPLDKGAVPWLGHALEFGKDPPKFLTRMKNKHGDIFTVRMAGKYITVLLDPHSYDAVLYDTVSLDFSGIRGPLLKRVFSLVLPSHNPDRERAWMEQHFHGTDLEELRQSMDTHLRGLLLAEQRDFGAAQWREEGLFDLCYSLLFRAGYRTLFARDDDGGSTDAVYKQFRVFDQLLPKLARPNLKGGRNFLAAFVQPPTGGGRCLLPQPSARYIPRAPVTPLPSIKQRAFCPVSCPEDKLATSTRESLWQLLSPPAWLDGPGGPCWWQKSYQSFLGEVGVDAETQRRALLMQLWTTQCNAGPASFWLLGFLLRHPEAMQAVQAEVRGVLQEPSLHHSSLEQLRTQNTPVFDSVLRETLRLTAAAYISREVVAAEGKRLPVSGGREYCLRQGDRSFRYKRFLNDDMSEKRTFYKAGSRLKYFSMPWGAGANSCVGKQFAVCAVKLFVFLVLSHLELELCEPTDTLPPVNPQRYGLGILQPCGDLRVRYRFRHN